MGLMLTQTCRPRTISEVTGQDTAKECLKSIVKKPEMSPRILILYGPYGTGKTTLARAFARALNCENKTNGDACGTCSMCRNNLDNIPYYEEYDSSVVGNVESVRQMKETFDYSGDNYRVIVLDEAQLMSKAAQSALLKVFEEVSTNIFFVLCTTDKDSLIKTIQSRAFAIKLDLIPRDKVEENIRDVAKKNNIEITDEDIRDIIKKSNGHLRDAHILLQSYALLDRDTYRKTTIPLRQLMLSYINVCLQKRNDLLGVVIPKILNFPLVEIKREYEEVVSDIFENLTVPNQEKLSDGLLKDCLSHLQGKTMILYPILCDKLVFESFESDSRAKAIFYIIYQEMMNI